MKYFLKFLSSLSFTLGIIAFVAAIFFIGVYDLELFRIPAAVWKNPQFELSTPFYLVASSFISGLAGLIFTGLGSLAIHGRYLWLSWLPIGICYCALTVSAIIFLLVIQPSQRENFADYLFAALLAVVTSLPGIFCIILALMVRKPGPSSKLTIPAP